MTNQLSFHSTTLTPIIKGGQTWLTSADLAKALGYSTTNAVTKAYIRHEDEFTACMTQCAKLGLNGINNSTRLKDTRIFSLRGCHLIAMFSRTDVAKEFRRWVLNILDKETAHEPEPILLENNEEKQHQKNYQLINDMIAHMALPNRPVVVPYVEMANLVLNSRQIQKSTLNLLKACDGIDDAINKLKANSGKSFGDFKSTT